MPIGILFWVLFVLWVVLGFWNSRADLSGGNWAPAGVNLVLVLLVGLLGWAAFGFIVR